MELVRFLRSLTRVSGFGYTEADSSGYIVTENIGILELEGICGGFEIEFIYYVKTANTDRVDWMTHHLPPSMLGVDIIFCGCDLTSPNPHSFSLCFYLIKYQNLFPAGS